MPGSCKYCRLPPAARSCLFSARISPPGASPARRVRASHGGPPTRHGEISAPPVPLPAKSWTLLATHAGYRRSSAATRRSAEARCAHRPGIVHLVSIRKPTKKPRQTTVNPTAFRVPSGACSRRFAERPLGRSVRRGSAVAAFRPEFDVGSTVSDPFFHSLVQPREAISVHELTRVNCRDSNAELGALRAPDVKGLPLFEARQ